MNDMNREQWLIQATELLEKLVLVPANEKTDRLVRAKIAVSVGNTTHKKALGECWKRSASEDNDTNQIFITAKINDSAQVLNVLLHELIHAYDDCESGHTGAFKHLALACGLTGKMTSTKPNDELSETFADIVDALGDIPHVKLDPKKSGIKKQNTRMLKIECLECGLVIRASKTQVERIAANHNAECPCCNSASYPIIALAVIASV